MKPIITTLASILLIFLNVNSYCQYHTTYKDEYGRKIGESDTKVVQPFQVQSMFVPDDTPWDLIIKIGEENNRRMEKIAEESKRINEKNREYLNALLDWVLELKNLINDYKFTNTLNIYYHKLRSYTGTDISYDKLNAIELDLKLELSNYQKEFTEKNSPKEKFKEALECYKKRDFNNCKKILNELITNEGSEHNNEDLFIYRGLCYEFTNNLILADADYTKAIEINYMNEYGYYFRALIRSKLKDYDKAIDDCNKHIENYPKDAKGYYRKACIKFEMKNYFGAIIDFNTAISFDPNNSEYYNELAWTKVLQQKYLEALPDVNKALEINPNNANALDTRGTIKFYLNKLEGSLADINRALEIDPKQKNSYFIRGQIFKKQGKKQLACEDLNKAVDLGERKANEIIKLYCN